MIGESELQPRHQALLADPQRHRIAAPGPVFDDMDKLLGQGGNAGLDRNTAIAAYRGNYAKVREVIRADRRLVFNPAQGWGPICRFLRIETPKTESATWAPPYF